MFRSIAPINTPRIAISIDGRQHQALRGATVADALLEAGIVSFRAHPVTGEARGPYCLMGACFECLVTIDDAAARQACLVQVAPGMRIETMAAVQPDGD